MDSGEGRAGIAGKTEAMQSKQRCETIMTITITEL